MTKKSLLFCVLTTASCAPVRKGGGIPAREAADSGGLPSEETPIPPSDPSPTEVTTSLVVAGVLDPLVDTLATDLSAAHALTSVQLLTVSDEGVHFIDETHAAPTFLGPGTLGGGIALDARHHLLLLDDTLMVWDGTWLQPSPLQSLLPVPVESIAGHDAHVWMVGAGQLFHHTDGTLSALALDGETDVRSVTADRGSLCAVMAPYLTLLDGQDGTVSVVDFQPERLATSMSFDADGFLWLADGSTTLSRRSPGGQWGALTAEVPIAAVHGNPHSDTSWMRTETEALHHRNGTFHSVEVPDGEWVGVDALGRLLIQTPAGLERIAGRRSVGVSGLLAHSEVDDALTLAFASTHAESVSAFEAWVDTEPLTLDPLDGTTTLDPVALDAGDHILRMSVAGPEGTTITELPFSTRALPDAEWTADIEPIMQQHCSRCHGEATAIPLHTADLWSIHIDRILAQVVAQDMPLGGPYLSDDEIDLIRGWREGGFP